MNVTSGEAARAQGLSLVEVLVALVVIAVAFVALSANQLLNLRVTRDAKQASLATQLANHEVERLAQLVLEDFDAYKVCTEPEGCEESRSEARFTVTQRITYDPSYLERGLVAIDVRVTGDASAHVARLVSCMDLEPPPTIAEEGSCDA